MSFFKRKRTILVIEILLIIAVYLGAKAYSQRNLISGFAPEINATELSGQKISLIDRKGKPVLVHFWASWCPVCRLEEKSINAISQDHEVISIAMQSGNDMEVAAYMKENNLHFPTIIDEHGELAKQYGVRGVPSSFIIDRTGNIKFTEIGYTTEIGLRARIWFAGN